MTKKISLTKEVSLEDKGKRLDLVTASYFPEFSRVHIQKWIKNGFLLLDGKKVKPRFLLEGQELISIDAEDQAVIEDLPEKMDLEILFEDDSILVVNKPAGLVVHPGAGNLTGTLVNGLLSYDKELEYLPRAGIVHRLDKDTSGLMVVAKSELAYLHLVKQLKERTVKRKYLALVVGTPISGGTINSPLGRHPKQRTKQAILETGKEAITDYSIEETFNGYAVIMASLRTGRTHQIRVHLSSIDYPIVGDPLYGGRKKFASGTSEICRQKLSEFKRQALHAFELSFIHPVSEEVLSFQSDIPKDMHQIISFLKSQ
jgi:23S rRNA pseudouridine1911/1915/1917 synthase|tara:strand:- start:2147 stop:3091 length:945 start_codon:yes stop_codon:yes gene_type:complete